MSSPRDHYIHGAAEEEQRRLSAMNDRLLNEACLSVVKVQPGERILDVGSGLGQFTRTMARACGQRVLGIEYHADQLAAADSLAAAAGESALAEFRRGDARSLPLKPEEWGQFDLAHARFVLEHIPEADSVVQQMARALRPGGRIALIDDDHANFRPYPSPPGFETVWEAYCRSYDRLGCDPYIGRRLTVLLHRAGLQPMDATLIFFGACAGQPTFPIVADNLIGILSGARELMISERLIQAETFELALDHLREWKKRPDAALWYGINYAEGVKRA